VTQNTRINAKLYATLEIPDHENEREKVTMKKVVIMDVNEFKYTHLKPMINNF
jgi:hypothetical protein